MNLRFPSSFEMKTFLDHVAPLTDNGIFLIAKKGLSFQAMDGSHVALLEFFLAASYFNVFQLNKAKSLGVSLVALAKVFKQIPKESTIVWTEKKDKVIMLVETSTTQSAKWELPLMNIDTEQLAIPDTRYPCVLTLPTKRLYHLLNNLSSSLGADTVEMFMDETELQLTAENASGMNATLREKVDVSLSIRCIEPQKCSLALGFLLKFVKASPLTEKVTVSLLEDNPVKVSYVLPEEKGFMHFFLAPKIDEE